MKKILDTYRTADGGADFCFLFEEQEDRSWRPYIVSQPDYDGRPDGPHETHRLTGPDGRRYICWTDALQSLQEAKAVAAMWADETQKYRNGLPAFEEAT